MSQKVALITAAGSGMGAEIARKLAEQNYKVAILSSSGKGEALAQELGGIGVTGSNQNVADLERFVQSAMDAYGRIDCVINSAGHGPRGPILELSDEDWHLGMEVYFLHVVRISRLVTPIMAQSGGGSIVNISTFATFEPDPVFPTSGAFRASLCPKKRNSGAESPWSAMAQSTRSRRLLRSWFLMARPISLGRTFVWMAVLPGLSKIYLCIICNFQKL